MELNFFEPFLGEIKPEKRDNSNLILIPCLALLMAFVIGSVGYNFLETKNLNNEIASVEAFFEDDSVKQKVREIDAKLKEIDDMKLKAQYLKYLEQDMKNIDIINDRLLDFIKNEVVEDLQLEKLVIEGGNIEITGRSLTKMGIAQFEYDLRNSGNFYDLFVERIVFNDEGSFYEFKLVFEAVGGGK